MSKAIQSTEPPAIAVWAGHVYTPVPPDGYIQLGPGAVVPVQVVGGDALYPVDPAGCAFRERGCPVCQQEAQYEEQPLDPTG